MKIGQPKQRNHRLTINQHSSGHPFDRCFNVISSRLLILSLLPTGFGKMLFFNEFPDSHAWR
jgi:hypothetical protein